MPISPISRSLGAQRSGSPVEQAREALRRLMSILYDKDTALSDSSDPILQGLIGSTAAQANVRMTQVLILAPAHNLYRLAERYGGNGDEGKVPIQAVTNDYLEVTGGARFGNSQYMIHGKIGSTGQEATLFIDPEDESIKELIIYETEEPKDA